MERLVERGPDMFMDPMEERGARDRALEDSVQQAEQSGLSADGACRLRDILSRRVDAFRHALRGDPPARVEPMKVQLCLLYTSPSPRDKRQSRMPSSA